MLWWASVSVDSPIRRSYCRGDPLAWPPWNLELWNYWVEQLNCWQSTPALCEERNVPCGSFLCGHLPAILACYSTTLAEDPRVGNSDLSPIPAGEVSKLHGVFPNWEKCAVPQRWLATGFSSVCLPQDKERPVPLSSTISPEAQEFLRGAPSARAWTATVVLALELRRK
jgi:hypothetical protein